MPNQIIKCVQSDLLYTKPKVGQIYFVTNSRALYKDYGNSLEKRLRFNAIILNTEYERENRIKPEIGKFYYVEETNTLWMFDTRWNLKIGNIASYNSFSYYDGPLSPVINTDSSITNSRGDVIIDNNGLLGDGSVVVRDNNRIIKGNITVDNLRQQLHMNSYVDDGILFIPNAHLPYDDLTSSYGALHLTVDKDLNKDTDNLNLVGNAYYYGDWNNYGDMYIIEKEHTNVSIDYLPLNNKEVVKTYLNCSKTFPDEGEGIEITRKTYVVIRPLSESEALLHIIRTDNDASSVVQNDMGELIFTNYGEMLENVTFSCTRKTYTEGTYKFVEYVLDNYSSSIIFKYNKNETIVSVPEEWSNNGFCESWETKLWVKKKILTDVDIVNGNTDMPTLSELQRKIGTWSLSTRIKGISVELYWELFFPVNVTHWRVLINNKDVTGTLNASDSFVTSPVLFGEDEINLTFVFENLDDNGKPYEVFRALTKSLYKTDKTTIGNLLLITNSTK